MRYFSFALPRSVRALLAVSLVVAAGCGGGSGSSTLPNPGSTQICDPDAGSITIARPTAGFPQNGNTVEIVSSSSTDQLHGNPPAFDLLLNDTSGGGQLVTNTLTIVPDNSGPHPFTNDFYYQGTIQNGSLIPGHTYNVFLNAPNTACTPGFVGQIFA